MTFLDTHLVIKIRDRIKSMDFTGFVWFDRPIYDKNFVIDRIKWDPYQSEEVLPLSWYALSRQARFKIYKALYNNEVYVKQKLSDDYHISIKPKYKENEPK